jgi:hypothetical protein
MFNAVCPLDPSWQARWAAGSGKTAQALVMGVDKPRAQGACLQVSIVQVIVN